MRFLELMDDKNTQSQGNGIGGNNSNDPITQLGGQAVILAVLIIIKLSAQCCGVDASNEGEVSNSSFFRLHEAF